MRINSSSHQPAAANESVSDAVYNNLKIVGMLHTDR